MFYAALGWRLLYELADKLFVIYVDQIGLLFRNWLNWNEFNNNFEEPSKFSREQCCNEICFVRKWLTWFSLSSAENDICFYDFQIHTHAAFRWIRLLRLYSRKNEYGFKPSPISSIFRILFLFLFCFLCVILLFWLCLDAHVCLLSPCLFLIDAEQIFHNFSFSFFFISIFSSLLRVHTVFSCVFSTHTIHFWPRKSYAISNLWILHLSIGLSVVATENGQMKFQGNETATIKLINCVSTSDFYFFFLSSYLLDSCGSTRINFYFVVRFRVVFYFDWLWHLQSTVRAPFTSCASFIYFYSLRFLSMHTQRSSVVFVCAHAAVSLVDVNVTAEVCLPILLCCCVRESLCA